MEYENQPQTNRSIPCICMFFHESTTIITVKISTILYNIDNPKYSVGRHVGKKNAMVEV